MPLVPVRGVERALCLRSADLLTQIHFSPTAILATYYSSRLNSSVKFSAVAVPSQRAVLIGSCERYITQLVTRAFLLPSRASLSQSCWWRALRAHESTREPL